MAKDSLPVYSPLPTTSAENLASPSNPETSRLLSTPGLESGDSKDPYKDEEDIRNDSVGGIPSKKLDRSQRSLRNDRNPFLYPTCFTLTLIFAMPFIFYFLHTILPQIRSASSTHSSLIDPSPPHGTNPLEGTDSEFASSPFASIDGSFPIGHPEQSPTASSTTGVQKLLSNGTHDFETTVIIISLDGVRWDYLERGLTPGLLEISRKGFRAQWMKSIFPTLTFPNHWSLLTGLYASSHGIVANDFWDPADETEFKYTDPEMSWSSKWWKGEPIWETAIKNGIKTGNIMWPGPPLTEQGNRPTYWYPFKNHVDWKVKLDHIKTWLDMPLSDRPRLITGYIPDVDQEGHRSGPISSKVDKVLTWVDSFATALHEFLESRNLDQIVDVIWVSDHGMTSTSDFRLIYLDDILGEEGFNGIEHKDGWPSAGLRFAPNINSTEMLERLLAASKATSPSGFNVYTPETMPEKWHFSGNERIPDIYMVPDNGWAITNRQEHLIDMKGIYHPLGNHGYDNDDPDMRAIFVAHGPFAESLKSVQRAKGRRQAESNDEIISEEDLTTVIDGFPNIEIYNLVAKLLGIKNEDRALNNGTENFWENYLGEL